MIEQQTTGSETVGGMQIEVTSMKPTDAFSSRALPRTLVVNPVNAVLVTVETLCGEDINLVVDLSWKVEDVKYAIWDKEDTIPGIQ